jgi:DNA-binding SARP family transcriptional activator
MDKGRGQQRRLSVQEQIAVQGGYNDENGRSTLELLQFVQDDYSQAKKQLETIYFAFRDREFKTGEQVRTLLKTEFSGINSPGTDVQRDIPMNSDGRGKTAVRAYCFGTFELYINWDKVQSWHSQKAKTLFKYMITRRKKPVTRELLVETLWPDCEPEVGRNNLKAAIYSLRQTLSSLTTRDMPQIVLFTEGQYMINPEVDFWIDIDEFDHYWSSGRAMEKESKKSEAAERYRQAQELYRGDYFEDDLYLDWTMLPREALKDTYLAILAKLAHNSFEDMDYESCIIYSQKILGKDMCHEEAYRWLIKCYFALGQYHRARQWYQVCENTLKRELDISPDKKTAALLYQLRNQLSS